MNELEKYFQIVSNLRSGRKVDRGDIEFFYSYTPEIDNNKLQKLIEGGEFPSFEAAQSAVIEAGRQLQSSPKYKQDTLALAQEAEAGRISQKVAQGLNLVLGTADIATSIKQIREGDKAAKNSKRPSRPSIPQRDILLENALRSSQENTFDSERAIAPVRQEIADQYLNDIQGAKTASTGQAGSYGAFRQLAANRRNRAAMDLAPIQDSIRTREQQRTDNLLGMRADETQQMFQNQASLYPYDLQQYNYDQTAAANLGSTGRANLRDSLYGLGNQVPNIIGQNAAQRKYDRIRNQATALGYDPTPHVQADEKLRGYLGTMTSDDTPNYWEQLYGR